MTKEALDLYLENNNILMKGIKGDTLIKLPYPMLLIFGPLLLQNSTLKIKPVADKSVMFCNAISLAK